MIVLKKTMRGDATSMQDFIRSIRINLEDAEDSYYKRIPAIYNLTTLNFEDNITFFVGENGTGKSTLLEAIAVSCGFNPEGGSRNFMFSSRDTHSALHQYIKLIRGVKRPLDDFFLRAESMYNLATEVEELSDPLFIQGYGGKSLHAQSHGESFLALLVHRFRGKGLYLLDEPEAALSPQRQLSMLIRIHELAKDSQFIIATHSPILLGIPNATIYSFDDDNIHKISYEETESYQVTKLFLNSREQMLHRLLNL
jgi:predicted ATPase